MHAPSTLQRKPGPHRPGFRVAGRGPFVAAVLAAPVLVAAWLACLPATAAAQVSAASDYLARMDADRDGRVSLAEYQDWLSYAFDAMDRNRDGRLDPAELPGGTGRAVTRTEHRSRLAEAFARQDRNRDGMLTAAELAAPPR